MASAASGLAVGPRDPTESAWDPGSSDSADPEASSSVQPSPDHEGFEHA